MIKLVGEQHNAVLEWLLGNWWKNGPPVAVIQGFPGIGKTEIALQAMTEFRKAHSNVAAVLFDCPETTTGLADDLLLTLAEELAAVGDTDLVEGLERGEDANSIFARVLAVPRLIVVDEAQRLLIGSTSDVSSAIAAILERLSRAAGLKGRLLLLTNREFGTARWTERVESTTLFPPKASEAEAFLRAELQRRNLGEAIPAQRYREVVSWLGCNPRALRLLASALSRESLDELIGLAPEAWEVRDRPVSAKLLREFERAVLTRAEERLDQPTQTFLRRLSVLRRPFDRRAMEALTPNISDMVPQRDELIARFILEFRNYFYELHPVLRDTVRLRMSGAENRRAHLAAGRFYSAPFRALRTLGEAEKLGARFIEARYHLTLAESERDLTEISERFETHLRAQFQSVSPVPSDPQERDERIALLSALLQARGSKGLEYYLTRCLVARNQPGDMDRALPHARRATGPQAPSEAWVLRIKIENQIFGSAIATQTAREGIKIVPSTQNLFSLYQVAAEILERDGKPREAVTLLREGMKVVPPTQSLSSLYQVAAEILDRDGKPGEAVTLLREGMKVVPPTQNLFSLYQVAAEILERDGKPGEAVTLLREGMKVVPPTQSLSSLYQVAAEILDRDGKPGEAVTLLREVMKVVPPTQNLFSLYQVAAEILDRDGKPGEAVTLLREGMKVVPPTQLFPLYQVAAEILDRDGKPGEAVTLLREGISKVPVPQNRYKLTEALIFIAYRRNEFDKLQPEQYDAFQRDCLIVVRGLAAEDFAGAAKWGTASIARGFSYFPLFTQTAFAFLCAGEPDAAARVLQSYPKPILEEPFNSTSWLLAFVAFELGNRGEAEAHLEKYLGRTLGPDEAVSKLLLVRLWDQSGDLAQTGIASHFPRLPQSLTGLAQTLGRQPSDKTVLTKEILEQLKENGQEKTSDKASSDSSARTKFFDPTGWL